MRLGQLARTLHTTIPQIVNYVSEQGITIAGHPNEKLNEEVEARVIAAFSEEHEVMEKMADQEPARVPSGPVQVDVLSAEHPEDSLHSAEKPGDVEIIKAPKIELPGLKVVGKIELPEPKTKKEETVESPEDQKPNGRKSKSKDHRRKPAETAEEREVRRIRQKKARQKREQKEKERQKQREHLQIKQRKEKFYRERIQKAGSLASGRNSAKNKSKANNRPIPDRPKTLLGRFWRWLNT